MRLEVSYVMKEIVDGNVWFVSNCTNRRVRL